MTPRPPAGRSRARNRSLRQPQSRRSRKHRLRKRPPPQSPPAKPALADPRGPAAGGGHRRRCPGLAVVLWRRDRARWAPQLASAPSLPPEDPRSPRSPRRLPFRWPRRRLCRRKATPASTQAPPGTDRLRQAATAAGSTGRPTGRTQPQRLRIKPSCCKRSRAIWRIWSATSNSSGRTSSKWPATIQKPSGSSRRARKR